VVCSRADYWTIIDVYQSALLGINNAAEKPYVPPEGGSQELRRREPRWLYEAKAAFDIAIRSPTKALRAGSTSRHERPSVTLGPLPFLRGVSKAVRGQSARFVSCRH
jgi:hypothetical protein